MGPIQPEAGLAAWLADWLRQHPPASAELVLARGGGEHLAWLAERVAPAVVLAWSEQRPATAHPRLLSAGSRDDRVGALARLALTLGLESVVLDPPEELLETAPSRAEFHSAVEAWRRQARVEQDTLRVAGSGWLDHLEANLPRLLGGASTADLGGLLSGEPLLVVGSGPSRAEVVGEVLDGRDRVRLLATNSAVRPLAAAGVRPDAVAVIEGADCRSDVAGLAEGWLSRSVLLAKASTHPAHLDWPFGGRAAFLGPSDGWLEPWFGPGCLVPTGGNAGTTALVLAWLLGADPVLFTGLDFALAPDGEGGRRGGRGAPTVEVRGWNGQSLRAEWPFVCYREQTEQALAVIRRHDPERRFVCVSRGGAAIAGAEMVPWTEVLAGLERLPDRNLAADAERRPRRGRDAVALGRGVRDLLEKMDGLLRHPFGPALALVATGAGQQMLRTLVAPALIEARVRAGADREAGCRAVEALRRRLARIAAAALRLAG